MKKIITKDGSVTFKNESYDETYHSTSGALEEAFEKFAKPCNLKDGMNVLDICFGIGYNSLAAIVSISLFWVLIGGFILWYLGYTKEAKEYFS